MARDNMEVQNRIFERLELLLEIQGAHQELSAMLTEVSQFKRSIIFFRSKFIRFCICETYVFMYMYITSLQISMSHEMNLLFTEV